MGSTVNYIYPQYKSVWREIDNNAFHRLVLCPNLSEKINEKDRDVTPLFLACMRKNYNIVEYLLQNGADPNIECKSLTPLYLACLYAESEIAEILINYGADVNVLCTLRKIAPIHLAASKGTMDILHMLGKANANVSILSPKYGTALHVAISKNHKNVTRYLLDQNISLNMINEEGETPLHIASRLGFIDIVRTLLDKNADPTTKDNDGNTCLHLACLNNAEAVALLLISRFPDLIYSRNNIDRQTPFYYAMDGVRNAMKRAFTTKMPGFVHSINKKDFSDIQFSVQNKIFYGHKVILKQRCPSLLSAQKTVTISDVEANVFLAFLTYLYTDSVDNIDKLLLPKLANCAEKFKIVRLKKICLDLTTTINVDVPDSTFKEDMKQTINNPEFSDIILTAEGKPFYCHKVILTQHEYFRALFSQSLMESKQKEILMDISFPVFEVLINYSYTWEMKELQPDTVVEVFLATDKFMIEGLRHGCEEYLCSNISKENVLYLFQLADIVKSLFLREECIDFIITSYRSVVEKANFKELPQELQLEITQYIEHRTKHVNSASGPKGTKKDKNFSLL